MLSHSRKLGSVLVVCLALAACACSKAKDGGTAAPTTAPSGMPANATPPAAPAATADTAKPAGDPEGKPHAEGEGYVVEVKAPASGTAGAEGSAQVVLNATGQYHLNKDFPTKLEVTAPDGVTLAKVTLTK